MAMLQLWMRTVGIFYLFLFITVVFLQKPIQVEGPENTLQLAETGDPLANFVVDTWFTIGMGLLALGLSLIVASKNPQHAVPLAWTIIAFELIRGIIVDLYKLTRGTYPVSELVIWIMIHLLIIILGVLAIRKSSAEPVTSGSGEKK